MSLQSLPPLLRGETALTNLMGQTSGVLAVPEPGRAFVLAGLAHLSDRHPVVVAVATTSDAKPGLRRTSRSA